MPEVVIEFPNRETAETFVSWMSEQGEQDIEVWLECRNEENKCIPARLSWVYGFPAWNKAGIGTGDLLRIRAQRIPEQAKAGGEG